MALSTLVVALDGIWPAVSDSLQVTDVSLHRHEYWRLFTYVFPQENGWAHLAVNMFTLFLYGWQLERVVGARRFLVAYFGTGAAGMLLLSTLRPINATTGLRSGASLATFGVVAAIAATYVIRKRKLDGTVGSIVVVCLALLGFAALITSRGTPGVVSAGLDGAVYGAVNHSFGLAAGLLVGATVAAWAQNREPDTRSVE